MDLERTDLEARCREILPAAMRERFDRKLDIAQRYTLIRDEQVADVTIGWPLLRRALRRLGEHLVEVRVLAEPDDAYYLQRAELDLALAGRAPHVDVTDRKSVV